MPSTNAQGIKTSDTTVRSVLIRYPKKIPRAADTQMTLSLPPCAFEMDCCIARLQQKTRLARTNVSREGGGKSKIRAPRFLRGALQKTYVLYEPISKKNERRYDLLDPACPAILSNGCGWLPTRFYLASSLPELLEFPLFDYGHISTDLYT